MLRRKGLGGLGVERITEKYAKRILNRRPIGRTRKGRPQKRWMEKVQEDMRAAEIRD